MRRRIISGFGWGLRGGFALLLAITGYPLLRPWLPEPPLPVLSGAPELPPVDGEIVITLKPGVPASQLGDLSRSIGASSLEAPTGRGAGILVARVATGGEAAAAETALRDPRVAAAGRQYRYTAFGFVPNDPLYARQWNLKMVGAEEAWKRSRGKGAVVAVIDTGVAIEEDERCYRCRDFRSTPMVRGYDFVNGDDHPADDHGHGTHVAATVAESTNNREGAAGLAFEAQIMPIKVLDAMGGGRTSDIARGVRFAADHGAQVINMSLGGPFPDPVLREACRYAAGKGVLIVCAAGNSSGGRVGYPAAYKDCLAVSAVGPSGELAPYSSIGKQVALAAPGGDTGAGPDGGILQNTVIAGADGKRDDGYFSFQGTSMASPHVAAAAALLVGAGLQNPARIRQVLQESASKKGPAEKYGAGVLNAGAALKKKSSEGARWWAAAGAAGGGAVAAAAGVPAGLLAAGAAAPLLASRAAGPESLWNLLICSGLVCAYLLTEFSGRRALRRLSLFCLGYALFLGYSAVTGATLVLGAAPDASGPWLWVNFALALTASLTAYRRSHG